LDRCLKEQTRPPPVILHVIECFGHGQFFGDPLGDVGADELFVVL
jgi:hypothetical protein